MNTPAPLQDLIEALVRMNAREIVTAATAMESLGGWSEEFVRVHSDDLRRAAGLAKASAELWSEVCELSALDAAGYSALGLATTPEASRTGVFHG